MIARRSSAIVLAVIATAIAAWFVLGLRAHHYADEAQRAAQSVDIHNRPQVAHLDGLYVKAARWNADPAPRIGRASLDLAIGRRARGIRDLESVARRNPGNLPSRLLLARAFALQNRRAETDAVARQLRTLYGRVGVRSARTSVRDAKGSLLPVVTDWVESRVETRTPTRSGLYLAGWAFSRTARAPAAEILVFSDGRLRLTITPRGARDDVARSAHLPPAAYGFSAHLPPDVPTANLELFAMEGGIASALSLPKR